MNPWVCIIIAICTMLIGHLIGYKTRKREEKEKPITILVEEKDMDDVARSLSKAVVILSSNGKIIDQLKLSIFHPHTDVTKNQ